MRKLKLVMMVVVAMTFSGYLFAQYAGDGHKNTVVGSRHDLGANNSAPGATLVCEFCHSPHKTNPTPGAGKEPPLLWNIQIKAGPFAVYGGSSTFQGADIRDPSGAGASTMASYMSLLCLSCHDGTVTQSNFYRVWTTYADMTMTNSFSFSGQNIGDNPNEATVGLGNDHPVDFTYSAALAAAEGGLQTPTEGSGVRIPSVGKSVKLPLFKDAATDVSGRLECATCHNVHNGQEYFLRIKNTGSAMCLNCHGN
jgi:predicted CXXCH cytochrome family protein